MSFFFDKQSMASVMDELVCTEDSGGSDDDRSSRGSTSSWDFMGTTTLTLRDIASSCERESLVVEMVQSTEASWESIARNSAGQTWYDSRSRMAVVAVQCRKDVCFTSIFDLLNLPRNASVPTVSHVFRMVSLNFTAMNVKLIGTFQQYRKFMLALPLH